MCLRVSVSVCARGGLQDCVEEMAVFSEQRRHLQQLGEELLRAGWAGHHCDQVHGSMQELSQRWDTLSQHTEAR